MGLIAWLGSAFASALGYSAVRFIAWKVVLLAAMTTVLPIVLMNVLYGVLSKTMSMLNVAQTANGVSGYVVQYTGLAAWFAIQLRLPECLSVYLSALMFRITVRMIPFVRL